MGTNAKLVPRTDPEEDERLLEETLFPILYCSLDAEPGAHLPDPEADAASLGRGDRKAVTRSARRAEELLLWYQAIGTPGGLYQLQALQALAKLLQNACLRLATHFPDFEFQVPLLPWLKANLGEWVAAVKSGAPGAESLEVLIKSLRTWVSLDKALGVISGESELTLRAAHTHLALLDKWIGGADELAVSIPKGANPEDPACPLEAGLPLGTRAIAKSAARAAASLYLMQLERAAAKAGIELDSTPYYRGSAVELTALARFDKTLVGRRPASEGPLVTFLAACDLALFTPLHPCFAHLRPGLRWDSLHPGLRLRRIIEVVADKGLAVETRDAKDYYRFTAGVCQALGWPDVPRFLDAGRKLEPTGTGDSVVEVFKAACALREDHPAAFLDVVLGASELSTIALPATQLASFETSPDADRALSFAMEAEIFALGFQVLHGGEQPGFVCAAFRETLEQFEKPKELLATYYGLEL
jgi:hypothetical protein